jgi:hypothetical protein
MGLFEWMDEYIRMNINLVVVNITNVLIRKNLACLLQGDDNCPILYSSPVGEEFINTHPSSCGFLPSLPVERGRVSRITSE